MAWEWFRQAGYDLHDLTLFGLSSLWTLAIGAASLHTVAWITAALVLRRPWGDGWRFVELLTIVTSGLMGGGVLWIALTLLTRHTGIPNYADWYADAAVPIFLSLFLLAATFFIGGASRLTGDGDREWWARSGSCFLIGIVCWTGAALVS